MPLGVAGLLTALALVAAGCDAGASSDEPGDDPLAVVFVWTFHEPLGRVPPGDIDPRIRLHAARDYPDVVAAVDAVPGSQVVLAPSSTVLEGLTRLAGGEEDALMELLTAPPDRLTTDHLDLLASAALDVPVGSAGRIASLPRLGDAVRSGAPLDDDTIRDLQVAVGLAWLDPDHAPGLESLPPDTDGFDREDREAVAAAHRRAPDTALDGWIRLVVDGSAEVAATTSDAAVAPLLVDGWAGAVGDPQGVLPANRFEEQTDGRAVIWRGLDASEAAFGVRPTGLVPAGGALSGRTTDLLALEGATWTVTGEDALARSLGRTHLREPGRPAAHVDLDRPWAAASGTIVLGADEHLGRLLREAYTDIPPADAAEHFLGELETVAATDGAEIVTVVVDGSTPWRHHAEGATPLFERILAGIASSPTLTTTTPAVFLASHAETAGELPWIWPGSFDAADLRDWVGEAEEADAWNLLWRVRLDLRLLSREGVVPSPDIFRAFEAMHRAESGDWLRWYGDDADSGDDRAMDRHLRSLLATVYAHLDRAPPPLLDVPVVPERPEPASDGGWTGDDAGISVTWTREGPSFAVRLGSAPSGFDLWVSTGDDDRRRVTLDGTPIGMTAAGLLRWSATAPAVVEIFDVPPFGSTETAVVDRIPAVVDDRLVTFTLPTAEGLRPGDPLRFRLVPRQADRELALVPGTGPGSTASFVTPFLRVADPVGDDHGPGSSTYPRDERFVPGSLDLANAEFATAGDELVVRITTVADLSNPFDRPSGVGLQIVDIAIDTDPGAGTGPRAFPTGRRVALPAGHGWEALVTVDGQGARVVGRAGDLHGVGLRVDARDGSIVLRIPRAVVGPGDPSEWAYAVTLAAATPDTAGGVLPLGATAARWRGGGAADDTAHPMVYDVLSAEPGRQESMLGDHRRDGAPQDEDDLGTVPVVGG